MPIGGRWRKGRSFKRVEDLNPYSGETLVAIQAASGEDLDEAYRVAAERQSDWAAAQPQIRRDVLLRAAEILVERKEEIAAAPF